MCPGKKKQQGVGDLSHHSGREGERGIAPDRQKEVAVEER
jgi:hypothetical protein